ncbi:hypothetical protein BKA63DRAFT_496799 [Paraphoma chrysanthemicola]|nr:hypothetical protein BKA63DRAFT_496799 [Paraphoma chrysanthemicola]
MATITIADFTTALAARDYDDFDYVACTTSVLASDTRKCYDDVCIHCTLSDYGCICAHSSPVGDVVGNMLLENMLSGCQENALSSEPLQNRFTSVADIDEGLGLEFGRTCASSGIDVATHIGSNTRIRNYLPIVIEAHVTETTVYSARPSVDISDDDSPTGAGSDDSKPIYDHRVVAGLAVGLGICIFGILVIVIAWLKVSGNDSISKRKKFKEAKGASGPESGGDNRAKETGTDARLPELVRMIDITSPAVELTPILPEKSRARYA